MNIKNLFGSFAPPRTGTMEPDPLFNRREAGWHLAGGALQGLGTALMTGDMGKALAVNNSALDDYSAMKKEKWTAQRLMEEAEAKKQEREQAAQRQKWMDDQIAQLPPDQQALARMLPEKFFGNQIEQQFAQPEKTDDMREYEWAVQNGYTGSPVEYMTMMKKSGASTVNVSGDMKLTEGQSKDVGFYSRGKGANIELDGLENALLDPASAAGGAVPVVGNWLKDPKYRLAERSAREFLAIVLRKDTGAAVTDQEFALYGPMYIPMPGDQPEDVKAKNVARKRVLQAIRRGAGTARPLYDEIDAELDSMAGPEGGSLPVPEGWDPEDWKYLDLEDQKRVLGQ